MTPKATENTITPLIADELKKMNVNVELFPSISTPKGTRIPDILCSNGGVYLIEAKFYERDLINAIAKIQNEYLKFHSLLGIKGGFAILYPEDLSEPMPIDRLVDLIGQLRFKLVSMFPEEDPRPFRVYEGPLADITKIIADNVLAIPKKHEPSIDYMIRTLRDSAMFLLAGLKTLSNKDLIGFFGGKEVFENILQYEESKYPVEELRMGAAYLLINQLLFYEVISSIRSDLEKIDVDVVNSPADLSRYFQQILDINYKVIYSYDVASLIPPSFTDQVKTIISVIQGLGPQKVGGDLLGTIFHDLIPLETRKKVAAYYTNVLAAELLASISIDRFDAKVVDFSVGSGGLLVASYRKKKSLIDGEFTQELHRKFVEEDLTGVDVMPFAANVAASHIALQSPQFVTNKVRIAVWDSTDLEPGKCIPSVASIQRILSGQTYLDSFNDDSRAVKGAVTLTGNKAEDIQLSYYDIVIMNPPFTRHERVPERYKRILNSRFEDYKDYLHGQMSYYCYFVLLADKFLDDGGKMALVLPATVLGGRSTQGIRNLWTEKYVIEYIVTIGQRYAFSEATFFRDILIIARKGEAVKGSVTKVVNLVQLPRTFEEAREIAEEIKHTSENLINDRLQIRTVDYEKFRSDTQNWYPIVNFLWTDIIIDDINNIFNSSKLFPLSSLVDASENDLRHYKFKNFHGFILRDERRAIRKTDNWVLEREESEMLVLRHREIGTSLRIPRACVVPGIRRLSYTDSFDVSDSYDYIAIKWTPEVKEMAKFSLNEKELKTLKKEMTNWRKKYNLKRSRLQLSRRLYLASPGTSLISFFSDTPLIGIDFWSLKGLNEKHEKILLLWLNSSLNIFQLLTIGVSREGSWMKLHKYMLDEIKVPNPHLLSDEDTAFLLNLFEKHRSDRLPSILEQFRENNSIRKEIDLAWLKILGYSGDPEFFLQEMYEIILSELEKLQMSTRGIIR